MKKINFSIKYPQDCPCASFAQSLAINIEQTGHSCIVHNEAEWNKEDSEINVAIYPVHSDKLNTKPWHFNILLGDEGRAVRQYDAVLKTDFKESAPTAAKIIKNSREISPEISERIITARTKLADAEFRLNGPLVSVLIATYNRKAPLENALKSILHQSYSNIEVCLVNDGGESIDQVVENLGDDRIKLISYEQNQGKATALNQAFEASSGSYIAYLDDDDIWYADHLEKLMAAARILDRNFVYSNGMEVLLNSKTEKKEISRTLRYAQQVGLKELLEFNYITGINVLHERSLFKKAGGFDPELTVLIDFDMWRRLACHAAPQHVNYTTAEYYLHQEQGRHITDLMKHDPLAYRRQRIRVLSKNLHLEDQALKKELEEVKRRAQFDYAVFNCASALDANDRNMASQSLKHAHKYYTPLYTAQIMYAVCLLRLAHPVEALRVFKDCINRDSDIASLFMACSVSIALKDKFAAELLDRLVALKKQMNEDQLKILNEYKTRYSNTF
ncbi:glycosyltransferase family 2 protein [Maridesulfovibrio sp.]|uniref:glycosyltransferase family 2 protein n=1 Tax=Maridesulfovibrio sp. TaxID=2795000 RepID=UPI0029F5808C|nr:glycosyltransferase family 2 protein [Maridesulfovibrio sp.]